VEWLTVDELDAASALFPSFLFVRTFTRNERLAAQPDFPSYSSSHLPHRCMHVNIFFSLSAGQNLHYTFFHSPNPAIHSFIQNTIRNSFLFIFHLRYPIPHAHTQTTTTTTTQPFFRGLWDISFTHTNLMSLCFVFVHPHSGIFSSLVHAICFPPLPLHLPFVVMVTYSLFLLTGHNPHLSESRWLYIHHFAVFLFVMVNCIYIPPISWILTLE